MGNGVNDAGKHKCNACGLGFASDAALNKHKKRTDALRCGADRSYKGSQ